MYLCADVTDIADGTTAKIKIVEKDADGNDDEVESPNTKIQNGKIKCKWKVVYMEDNDDADSKQEQKEKGYTLLKGGAHCSIRLSRIAGDYHC